MKSASGRSDPGASRRSGSAIGVRANRPSRSPRTPPRWPAAAARGGATGRARRPRPPGRPRPRAAGEQVGEAQLGRGVERLGHPVAQEQVAERLRRGWCCAPIVRIVDLLSDPLGGPLGRRLRPALVVPSSLGGRRRAAILGDPQRHPAFPAAPARPGSTGFPAGPASPRRRPRSARCQWRRVSGGREPVLDERQRVTRTCPAGLAPRARRRIDGPPGRGLRWRRPPR